MTEKLTYDAIEEMVEKAKAQTSRLIDSMFRQVVADFEMANSEGFKLALTIEGERRGQDATLTLQTKAQSAVDVKRKDQTQAEIVDWGPQLFDPDKCETIPEDEDDEPDEDEEERGPKLLCSASPVFDAAAKNGEVAVTEGEVVDVPAEEAPAEDDQTEDDQTEEDNGDAAPEDDAADEEPNN